MWIGDLTGETEIYIYDTAEGGEPRQLTSGTDTYIRSLQWAPDSKTLLYTDRKNRLVEVSIPSGAKRTIMQNSESEFRGVSFSPDSKWLTYTRPAGNEMNIVYVYNIASGKEYPVTERWYNSSGPVFSTDGKYLIFSSDRDINPQYSRIEWNFTLGNMGSAYLALLSSDTPNPLIPKDEAPAPEKADKPEKPEKAGKPDSEAVKIDPDGIWSRIVKLPFGGSGFYSDGKKIWHGDFGGT